MDQLNQARSGKHLALLTMQFLLEFQISVMISSQCSIFSPTTDFHLNPADGPPCAGSKKQS